MNTIELSAIMRKITSLRNYANNIVLRDTITWQVFYFGHVETLNISYLIIRPYMASDMGTYKVFIMEADNEECKEVDVKDTSVYVSSKSLSIITSYGTFSYNREHKMNTLAHKGKEYELSELSFIINRMWVTTILSVFADSFFILLGLLANNLIVFSIIFYIIDVLNKTLWKKILYIHWKM